MGIVSKGKSLKNKLGKNLKKKKSLSSLLLALHVLVAGLLSNLQTRVISSLKSVIFNLNMKFYTVFRMLSINSNKY